ncbi:MAG: glycosyltransferase [Candidatus Omnitrophica bacterium]|nr:glycosyltransferase [Candidatus Omnitrophota bacterium]
MRRPGSSKRGSEELEAWMDTMVVLDAVNEETAERATVRERTALNRWRPRWLNVPRTTSRLTVIIPAYNESGSLADTIRSLRTQTVRPDEIIVVDDCSTDRTGEVARALGVTVIRPRANTGSKAGAQNVALSRVQTELTMALDADTTLAPDAVEKLLAAFDDPQAAAVCGSVIPRYVRTVWERGRYIEYLFAFTFYKPIQDYYEKPLISSGCFSMYRTTALRANGGWSSRTMAEDMDLTWSFYQAGYRVRFVPEAVCYPIEPHDFRFMRRQLRRWSHGFVQNVRLHWRGLFRVPYLRSVVAVALWDALMASFAYFLLVPLLVWRVSPLFLFCYILDTPAVLVPVLTSAVKRNEVRRALTSIPAFWVLRVVNGFFFIKACWVELILRRPLHVYEKGH